MAGAGDVDADGVADVIVGVTDDDTGAANGGSVRVLSGADGGELFAFHGTVPQGRFGAAVDGAGDLNGDGHADLLAAASMSDTPNGESTGLVRAFSGADGSVLYALDGDDPGEHLGSSLAGGRDANGDGSPDFAVGASFDAAGLGSVRVVSGADGTAVVSFQGAGPNEGFGSAIDFAGDVNADGFADVVAGAFLDGEGAPDGGSARVFAVCGAQPYGSGSGASDAVQLAWLPGAPGAVSAGTLAVSGAPAAAPGALGISVGEGSLDLAELGVLIDLTPGAWVLVAFPLDASGAGALPLDLRQPALAGAVLHGQAIELVGPSVSNGLRLLFCR